MKIRMVEQREGEALGPIDWTHEKASGMPQIWRDAEKKPEDYLMNGRQIITIQMYDGWPYWKPMPAVLRYGPIGVEWDHFDSYGVYPDSITLRTGSGEAQDGAKGKVGVDG